MPATPRSFEEFLEIYRVEAQSVKPELTDFREGSMNDIEAGSTATLAQEVQRIILDRFKITYFQGAEGDDLELLATDHFGDDFERPDATEAVGIVEFSRPNADAGNVDILEGTIVKTEPDANGETQSFETILDVVMTGTTINASVRAVDAGPAGNVDADTIVVIESALTDPSIVVNNDDPMSGGAEEEDDDDYRDTILRLIQQLKGATKAAIQSTALNVAGVENAIAVEAIETVIQWNDATSMPIGSSFKIARSRLYIADANGTANDALISNVETAIETVRACGGKITVIAAVALAFDWKASISLNPSGPNFATLSADPQFIEDAMQKYIEDLAIGGNFIRSLARAAILAIWGPAGSDDLTDFVTSEPSGDVSVSATTKLIPGTIEVT